MKSMSYLILVVLFVQSLACNGHDKVVRLSDLPQAAQELLSTHFADNKPTMVLLDSDGLRTNYDVVLSDGTKIEFDKKGEWNEIDGKPQAVPTSLIPDPITTYVRQNFADVRIMQIERVRKGYEVTLSNGLELRFNKKFEVVEVDN